MNMTIDIYEWEVVEDMDISELFSYCLENFNKERIKSSFKYRMKMVYDISQMINNMSSRELLHLALCLDDKSAIELKEKLTLFKKV